MPESDFDRSRLPDEEAICTRSHAAELAREIVDVSATCPMPPDAKAAYAPDTISLFALGLPGEDALYTHDAEDRRVSNLREYQRSWLRTYGGHDPTADILEAMSGYAKAIRARLPGVVDDQLIGVEVIESIRSLESHAEGVEMSSVLGVVVPRLQLLYHPESPSVWDEQDITIEDIPRSDLEALFEPEAVPEGVDYQMIAGRLREKGAIDLSKETLDARFANFLGLSQVELPIIIMNTLYIYSRTGGKRGKWSVAFAERHREALAGDDVLAKQAVMTDLVRGMRATVGGIQGRTMRKLVGLLAARLNGVDTSFNEFVMFFSNAYDGLGYEDQKHPFIARWLEVPEEPKAPETSSTRVERVTRAAGAATVVEATAAAEGVPRAADEVTAVVEVEPEPLDPAVLAEITSREQALLEESTRASSAWRMSSASRKPYKDVVRELTGGVRNALGTQMLAPVIQEHAFELLAVIVRLDAMAAVSQEGVVEKVKAATDRQRAVRTEAEALYAHARAVGYREPLNAVQPVDVERCVRVIAANWLAFTQLIHKTWPGGAAPGVVARLAPLIPELLAAFPVK